MRTAALLLLLISLVSCGGSSDGTPYHQDSITIQSKNDFQKLVKESFLMGEAPKGLGLLIKRGNDYDLESIGTCTWFLVSKDVAATNSHCIPQALKDNPSLDCSSYIGGKFEDGSYYYYSDDTRFCKKVLQFSNIKDKDFSNPDYAFIKLDRPVELDEFFSISRAGFANGQETRIHVYDTEQSSYGNIYGNYKKHSCVSYEDSIAGGFYDSRSSIIPVFPRNNSLWSAPCRIIPGNSGSPVTGVDGNPYSTIGIAYATQMERYQSTPQMNLDKMHLFGLVTNFACQNLTRQAGAPKRDGECKNFLKNESRSFDDEEARILAEFEGAIIEEIEKKMKELPSHFLYTYETGEGDDENVVTFTPKCMVPFLQWDLNTRTDAKLSYNHSTDGTVISSRVEIPRFQIGTRLEVNEYGILSITYNFNRTGKAFYKVNNVETVSEEPSMIGEIQYYYRHSHHLDRTSPLSLGLCSMDAD